MECPDNTDMDKFNFDGLRFKIEKGILMSKEMTP